MFLQQSFTIFMVISVHSVSTVSVRDCPLELDHGNYLINAIATDESNGQQFVMKEYISSGNVTRGKIELTSKGAEFVFHYSSALNDLRSFTRKGPYSECTLFKYVNRAWDHHMTFTSSQYVSDTLVLGPSIMFRLKDGLTGLVRQSDVEIRGIMHRRYTVLFNPYTELYFYIKENNVKDGTIDITRSTRITIKTPSGYSNGGHVRIDFYSVVQTNQQLDVMIPPGTICSNKLTVGLPYSEKPIPDVGSSRIHFISLETNSNDGDKMIQKEVNADEKFQIVYMKTTTIQPNSPVQRSERIFDYTLGVVYEFGEEEGEGDGPSKCRMIPMDSSAPGLEGNSSTKWKFSVNQLLDLNGKYSYLGPVNYNHQYGDGFRTEAWQEDAYGLPVDGNKYDLTVHTQYFLPSIEMDNQPKLVLMGSTFHSYNKPLKGFYRDLKSLKKIDYQVIDSLQSEGRFRISDCYPALESRKTLELHFTCKDANCDHFRTNHREPFVEHLKDTISSLKFISISRISGIEWVFNSNDPIAYATFLESPDIRDAFVSRSVKVSADSLLKATHYSVTSNHECLTSSSGFAELFEAIAYCDGSKVVCARFRKLNDIIEDTKDGTLCTVTMIPLQNIYRYSKETRLADIEDKLSRSGLSFKVSDGLITSEYELGSVKSISMKETELEPLLQKTFASYKLIQDPDSDPDSVSISRVDSSTDFSSCYSSCVHSDIIDCRSFSFCQYPDRVECLVSSSLPKKMISDASCSIAEINLLNRYQKIESRRFIKATSIPFDGTLQNCVQLCVDSDECKSFQYCHGSSSCTLEGHYTDAATDSTEDCDIYIPQVLSQFRSNGKTIVPETFHTELGVNLAQCAALCYDWDDGDGQSCSSFNHCPAEGKRTSLCLLSRYSTEDTDNGRVKLMKDGNCRNYELTKKEVTNAMTPYMNRSNIPGSSVIVIVFVVSGLLTGIIVNVAYSRVKMRKAGRSSTSYTFDRHTFSWTRQLNDDEPTPVQDSPGLVDMNLIVSQ